MTLLEIFNSIALKEKNKAKEKISLIQQKYNCVVKLEYIRKQKGYNKKEFAESLGISQVFYANLRGKKFANHSIDFLNHLVKKAIVLPKYNSNEKNILK